MPNLKFYANLKSPIIRKTSANLLKIEPKSKIASFSLKKSKSQQKIYSSKKLNEKQNDSDSKSIKSNKSDIGSNKNSTLHVIKKEVDWTDTSSEENVKNTKRDIRTRSFAVKNKRQKLKQK